MISEEQKLRLGQQIPYLQVKKKQNETICGYHQKYTKQINQFCTSQYFGLVKVHDRIQQVLIQTNCCILISPMHAITIKNQFLNEKGEFIYNIDQINISFSEYTTQIVSFILLDRFVIFNLKLQLGDIFGYVGLVQKNYEQMNQEQSNYTDQDYIPFIQGFNEYGNISYFQALVYREDSCEYEAPNCGFLRLLQGCAMLKQDEEFGICLQGLVSFSDDKQRIIIQKLNFTDIFVIAEVVLAAGNTLSEQKIDISTLYSIDQKTFLNPQSNIYRKSLGFEDSIQSLEQLNKTQIQLIDIKIINTQQICAISKQGTLFIINIDSHLIEHTIQLDEQPSIVQVIHDELFIGLNKKIIVINYVQGYQVARTYNFSSQILSLKQIEDYQDDISQNIVYLVGCYDGLYQIKTNEKIPEKLEFDNFKVNKVLCIQINQEIMGKAPISQYNMLNNFNQLIISAAEKILIVDRKQKTVKKKFIGHSKNVYFIEQVRVNLLLSGSSDRQLILWDKKTGNLLKTIQHSSPLYSGYLLNQSELITIDYNTIWIFNTITFENTKYEFHKKPITCSVKASSDSFLTCDTSNQIILWKADNFIVDSFMESKFKIGKQQNQQVLNDRGIQYLQQRYSENECDFNYVPKDIRGPSLLKYQIELEEQKSAQQELQLMLEDQICQNIEDRLLYQQKIKQLKLYIDQKNVGLEKLKIKLNQKKQTVAKVFQEVSSKQKQENSGQKMRQQKQNQFQSSDSLEPIIVDSIVLKEQDNLMTVKKQGNIYIDDFVQTNQKSLVQNVSQDHQTKSSFTNQFSTEQTNKSIHSTLKLTQFETFSINNQNIDNHSSLNYIQSKPNINNLTNVQETKQTQTLPIQELQALSQQYQTSIKINNQEVIKDQYVSNRQFGFEENQNYLSDQIKQITLDTQHNVQDKIDLYQTEAKKDEHLIRFTVSNLQQDQEYQTIQTQEKIQRKQSQDEAETQKNHQNNEKNKENTFSSVTNNFTIKPIPLEYNQINNSVQISEKSGQFDQNLSNYLQKYEQMRQSDEQQQLERPQSNNLYIQQINQILNEIQNQKQLQSSNQQKRKESQQNQIQQSQDLQHSQQIQTNDSQQILISQNQSSHGAVECVNNIQQNENPLNLFNQLAYMIQHSNFMLEPQILDSSSHLTQQNIYQHEKLQKLNFDSKSNGLNTQENQFKQKQEQQQQAQDERILQKSNEKKTNLNKNENLVQKIEKMEKLEEKLQQSDIILKQLCSLIQTQK